MDTDIPETEGHEVGVKLRFYRRGDEFLRVRYRPLEPELLGRPGLVEQLAAVLIEIDLTDEGKRLEPTPEVLERIPLPVLSNIAETVFGDYYPQKKDFANLQLWYMERGHSRARPPGKLEIYEMALELNRTPDEIRSMSRRDRDWMLGVKIARAEAMKEMQRRAGR